MDRSDTDTSRRFILSRGSFIRLTALVVSTAYALALPLSAMAADKEAPTAPSNLATTSVSDTQISLSWTGSTDNVGVTAYLLERCKGAGCSNFAQIASLTSTAYNDSALTVSTSYSYRVRARDAANNKSAYSSVVTVSTLADTQPPTAPTGLSIAIVSDTQLTLSWTAATDDVKVTGYLVERCLGVACTSFAQVATPTATSYNNTALVPASSYSYRVRAKDAAGNLSNYSAVASASTLADTQAPTAPTGVTLAVGSNTKITVTWTASTDDVKVTGYLVERCQGVGCTAFTQVAAPTGKSFANTGLVAGSSYSYRVRATDAAGNFSPYSDIATATTTGTDTTAPSAPTGLMATPVSSSQINLSWTAATDNVAATNYLIERCQGAGCSSFSQIATSTNTTYSDTSLSASTSYSYRVRATDAANNLSTYSNTSSATTQTAADTQPPTPPTNLSATATSTTQINLTWNASTDNVGVTAYLLQRCQGASCSTFAQIASLTTTTYTDTSLTAATSYGYQVRATDAANNVSPFSNIATATTQSPAPVTFSYSYDSLGRLIQTTGTDGSEIDYQYDANGNATTINRH